MPEPEMRKINIATHKFFDFYIKKTWVDELIWLLSQYRTVFYFVLFV